MRGGRIVKHNISPSLYPQKYPQFFSAHHIWTNIMTNNNCTFGNHQTQIQTFQTSIFGEISTFSCVFSGGRLLKLDRVLHFCLLNLTYVYLSNEPEFSILFTIYRVCHAQIFFNLQIATQNFPSNTEGKCRCSCYANFRLQFTNSKKYAHDEHYKL